MRDPPSANQIVCWMVKPKLDGNSQKFISILREFPPKPRQPHLHDRNATETPF